jgi:septal ring-binding cell division protein DamX/type II secretory pathway predicted ATPase ExeA
MDALDPKDLQPQTMLGMKLIQQPFSKRPEAENLFDFDTLKQTRDTISHHLQFSHLLMIIQGRKGSGKDSLANSLIVSDHPALYFFNATAESGDNLQSILAKAAQNNNADSIQILEKRIHDIMYRGQQPVIIINNAEQLSETELRNLIDYTQQKIDSNQQTQLKLLLLGTPELEKNLERNGIINHNQFYLIALPQLNVSNTRSFLMHRLTLAGFRDASPFSDKDISDIFSMANGNPVATMEYAAECLNNNKSLYDENYSDNKKSTKPLLVIGAVLFIAAILYNSVFTAPDKNTDIETISEPLVIEKKAVDQLFNANTNTMDVKQEKAGTVLPKLTSKYSPPAYSSQPNITLNTELLTATQATTEVAPKDTATLPTEKIKEPVLAKPVEKVVTPVPNEPIKQPTTIKPVVIEKEKVKSTSKPVTAKKPQIKPVINKIDKISQAFINANARSSDWLLKQPANNWSLQILAGHEAETLLSYMRQHKLGEKVAYFRTRLGNKDWHVILYGQYKSKEQAKSVIPYLPKYIQQNNPWPKDLKSVQKAIKQYKK